MEESIGWPEAVLGTEIDVPTVSGSPLRVRVPAATPAGVPSGCGATRYVPKGNGRPPRQSLPLYLRWPTGSGYIISVTSVQQSAARRPSSAPNRLPVSGPPSPVHASPGLPGCQSDSWTNLGSPPRAPERSNEDIRQVIPRRPGVVVVSAEARTTPASRDNGTNDRKAEQNDRSQARPRFQRQAGR